MFGFFTDGTNSDAYLFAVFMVANRVWTIKGQFVFAVTMDKEDCGLNSLSNFFYS